MKEELELVREFHEKFRIPILENFQLVDKKRFEFRYRVMKEEVEEYLEGCKNFDLDNVAKELADILYGVYGTILEHGLQDKIEDVFREVHKSNMGKQFSEESLKPIKGDNYSEADISGVLK